MFIRHFNIVGLLGIVHKVMVTSIDKNKIEGLRLTYIIGTYPLLTTTFIDREIRLLRGWGVNLQIVSIRQPKGELAPEQIELQKSVRYLLPVSVVTLLLSFFLGACFTAVFLLPNPVLPVHPASS